MKSLTGILLFLLSSQGCWMCPDAEYVEFNNSGKTITALSDDYYIHSITATEYFQKDGYIELDKIRSSKFISSGQAKAKSLSLIQPNDNFTKSGINYSEIANSELLQYKIQLQSNGRAHEQEKIKEIIFLSKEVSENKVKFGSSEPCP